MRPATIASGERVMGERRGLLIVYTGDGEGKTTAALGLALRAVGSGLRVSILQFVKQQETGEHRALARLEGPVEILRLGEGFVFRAPPTEGQLAAARRALALARERLTGGRRDLVVLDEIFPALAAHLVSEQEILDLARARPANVHLVMTGRDAPASIVDLADLVTEMRCVRHPHDRDVEAQPGIEL
jgi:cob(I)alamin adenosyltransferase